MFTWTVQVTYLKGVVLITSTYIDIGDHGELKLRFRTDWENPIWSGAGSLTVYGEELTGLNQAGRELAKMLGALPGVSSVELLSFDRQEYYECLVVAMPHEGVVLGKLSVSIREQISIYCGNCSLRPITLSETYRRKTELERSTVDIAEASYVGILDG